MTWPIDKYQGYLSGTPAYFLDLVYLAILVYVWVIFVRNGWRW